MAPLISVIIPTFNRAPFLKYALEALKNQTEKNFEIVIVVKPGQDETEATLKEYQNELPLRIVLQREEYVSKAYNMGLSEAKGEILAIMDDDSVPSSDWLERHASSYDKHERLGGVSGDALNAHIAQDGKLKLSKEQNHVHKRLRDYYESRFSYKRPLVGMSDWWIYFGKDGLVHQRLWITKKRPRKVTPSLLFMGANMSVRREAVEGLKVEEDLILGFSYEQLLAYQIWRRGYELLYDPSIRVLHIVHAESLGRFFKQPSRAAHRDAEYILSFFLLKPNEQEVSWFPFILELISLLISRAISGQRYGFNMAVSRIYGLMCGFIIGCAFSVSSLVGGKFSIANALHRFVK